VSPPHNKNANKCDSKFRPTSLLKAAMPAYFETGVIRARVPWYLVANVAFVFLLGIGKILNSQVDHQPSLVYLALLFSLCSAPILCARRLNGQYALFTLFLAIYFISCGLLDLIRLLSDVPVTSSVGLLSKTEMVLLLGGIMFVAGYQLVITFSTRDNMPSQFVARDWSLGRLVIVGLFLWIAGSLANWYWSVVLTIRSGEYHNNEGQLFTSILIAGRYLLPVGILFIAYASVTSRSRLLLALVIAVSVVQVFVGFVTDTKGGAMLGGVLVIVALLLVTGKVPKVWLFAGVLFAVFAFPLFTAYRLIVVGEHGFSNAEAARNVGKAFDLTVKSLNRVSKIIGEDRPTSFFERSTIKGSVEMIVSRTGSDVPFQHGYTLIPLITSPIPRIVWPSKLDIQVGQLLNKKFHVTDTATTYISPSHIGELYWNFGWAGVIGGMLGLGALMASINHRCDLSQYVSATRVLILAITMFELCARFEGSIAAEYSVWLRSVVAILVLHAMFSSRTPPRPSATQLGSKHSGELSVATHTAKYPNILQ